MHKSIETVLHFEVGDLSVAAVPKGLGGIGDSDVFEGYTVYLSEGFRGINETVEKTEVAVVPEGCAVRGGEMAVLACDVLAFPDDVHAFELAIDGFYAAGFFESGLAFANGDALYAQIATLIQRSFTGEYLVSYSHIELVIFDFRLMNSDLSVTINRAFSGSSYALHDSRYRFIAS